MTGFTLYLFIFLPSTSFRIKNKKDAVPIPNATFQIAILGNDEKEISPANKRRNFILMISLSNVISLFLKQDYYSKYKLNTKFLKKSLSIGEE